MKNWLDMLEDTFGLYVLEDREPRPAKNFREWVAFLHRGTVIGHNRRVALTKVGESWISTGFLTTDFSPNPRLFETMVWGGTLDHIQQRCSSFDQAEYQHREVCRAVRALQSRYPIFRMWLDAFWDDQLYDYR